MDGLKNVGHGTLEAIKSVFSAIFAFIKATGKEFTALYRNKLLRFGILAYIFGKIYKYRGTIKQYWEYFLMGKNFLMMYIKKFGNQLDENKLDTMTNEELIKYTNNKFITTTTEYN